MKRWFKKIGPGTLVAAAFIGPGTITMCSTAGVAFGYSLLWALLLSIIATISLQEMASRLGIISQKDLVSVISDLKSNLLIRLGIMVLVFSAIVLGNTAYEAGNISGGAIGLTILTGNLKTSIVNLELNFAPLITGVLAFIILLRGTIKTLQYVLLALVILMSFAFVTAAIITKPNLSGLVEGLFIYSMPEGSLLVIVGLIGTTVVPYNLFLHSALVVKKWNSVDDLKTSRIDTVLAVVLGGLVSMCVLIAAASVDVEELISGADLALALEPIFGHGAKYLMGIGLFAAGLTSAITAPLAAAFVVSGLFGSSGNTNSTLHKVVWITILFVGVLFSTLNIIPITLIVFAQVANGIFLPIIALVLIWIMNKKTILGEKTNSVIQNIVGILVFMITLLLSYRILINVL
ncbi:MAG: Nramp family divalent metal transporter [Bacteroidota bacterium]